MQNKNGENKALPFEVNRGFTAMPNSVSDFYTMHPRFTGATERLYLYLLRNYRSDKGYAYPGYRAIKEHTKIGSDSTVSNAIESLEYLNLIQVEQVRLSSGQKSNRYFFIKPIETYEEFVRRFGDDLPDKYLNNPLEVNKEVVVDTEEDDEFNDIAEWL